MPNIKQIESLRKKYGSNNQVTLKELQFLNESFHKTIYQIRHDIKSFSYFGVDDHIIPYFEEKKSANVVILFIDITSFSTKCENLSNESLSEFLDSYYDAVIPIIYQHGGEIEKIIGDGIICIFGEPFLTLSKSELFKKADVCAKDIIVKLKGTDKEVKIALHDGTIMYYKNKSDDFPEYTMIGKPLTELFRLENVSDNNSINYYHISDYDKLECSDGGIYKVSISTQHSSWKKSSLIKVELKGVSYSFIKKTTCTYKT